MAISSLSRKRISSKNFALPKKRKYPLNTMERARNAIARVQQHGSPSEKRAVYAAVKKKYPSLAQRSRVIPTRKGSGRKIGEPATKAGGSSVAGTIRRRKGGGRVASRKQIAAARRNLRKARAARRAKAVKGRKVRRGRK